MTDSSRRPEPTSHGAEHPEDPMTTTPEQETELVLQARRGDLSAFERLMAKYERAVFNIALYKSKNFFDAEDLSQDIFLSAFRALSTLKSPDNFAGWLFGIAYNRCHKWYRRERNKVLKIQEVRRRVADEERRRLRPGGGEAAGADVEHLSDVFARLPADVRDVLTCKYLEGCSYEDIERRFGINANRVDYLIRKGKQLIRERVHQNEPGGEP